MVISLSPPILSAIAKGAAVAGGSILMISLPTWTAIAAVFGLIGGVILILLIFTTIVAMLRGDRKRENL